MVDPRVARTRAHVLEAATELLVEHGPTGCTVDAIVARSGVAKSTIYRHWATRDEILVDVLAALVPKVPAPDADLDYQAALRQIARTFVTHLNDERWQRVLPALLLLRLHEPDIATFDEEVNTEQHAVFADVVERGRRERMLDPAVTIEQLVATLFGPILFAQLTGKLELDEALADHMVAVVLQVYAPAGGASGQT